MVLCALTRDASLTPAVMSDAAMDGGYYVDGVGTSWSFMEEAASEHDVQVFRMNDLFEEAILHKWLDDGAIFICSVGPGDFTDTGHFIVIRGYQEGKLLINDPFSMANSTKGWDYDIVKNQCVGAWAYWISPDDM